MKHISIDPITRLEGHGKIEIFLNDEGEVENAYFQVPELRGFEKFCEGRPVEELPSIVTKICGVCPGCHHMASGKAVDAVFGVEPPPTAKKLRELFYMAHFVHSHIVHFYALAAPDFVVGPTASPVDRTILGVINKVGLQIGSEVIKQRRIAQEIQALIGGLVIGCCVSYFLLRFFEKIPTKNPIFKALILSFATMVVIEVLSTLVDPNNAFVYLLIDTGMNVPRFLALGIGIGYRYDKLNGGAL